MLPFLLLIALALGILTGCAKEKTSGGLFGNNSGSSAASTMDAEPQREHWNPDDAIPDAERDIAALKIRFALRGGFFTSTPGLPTDEASLDKIEKYDGFFVGEPGCVQNATEAEEANRHKYASLYNIRMWRHLTGKVLPYQPAAE